MILVAARTRFNPQFDREEGLKYWFNEEDEKIYHESSIVGITSGMPVKYFAPPYVQPPHLVKTRTASKVIRFAMDWMEKRNHNKRNKSMPKKSTGGKKAPAAPAMPFGKKTPKGKGC